MLDIYYSTKVNETLRIYKTITQTKASSPIVIKTCIESYDRFMTLDAKEVYHFGASPKYLGKKWFAFSRFDMEILGMLERFK